MPIVPPSLDDRRFDDLVEDLIARIPAHTPEWTHVRPGDPGRTLIELFAWLGDTLLYRANLIPERQRLVFLRLLGLGLRPALPARGLVALSWAQPAAQLEARTLPPRSAVKAALPVETLQETTVLPISGEAYIKRALGEAELARRADVLQGLARIHRLGSRPLAAYETTPVFADGQAQPDGIDVFGASADRALWIALLAPPAPSGQPQDAVNAAVRAALGGQGGQPALLSVGVVPAVRPAEPLVPVASAGPVPVLWELTTPGRNGFDTDYLTLAPASDTSGGLTHTGTLRLPLAAAGLIWAPPNDVGLNPRAGVGDVPPRLDDAERAARLIGWLRLRPRPGAGVGSLRLAWVGLNAVEVEQRRSLGGVVLGSSQGGPDQVIALPLGSVEADSLRIEVEEPGRGYQPWQRVDDLGAISADAQVARDAAVYELDAEAGTLRFGDGVRGRVPDTGMRVRLAQGRFGGGRAGNLPAGTLTRLDDPRQLDGSPVAPVAVLQPLPLGGGDDVETLAQAERRIPALLRHRDRAVTEADYRQLALQTPGVEVGRVEVLPRFKPHDRRSGVPGVVSVMVLPDAALAPAPNPRADRPLIERVHAHLSARTPLATELYVIGCEYVPVGVAVAVSIRDGFGRDQVLLDVREALRRLLWPLVPGGFEQRGWPLGRAIRSRELAVAVARVEGVDEIGGLQIFLRRDNAWVAAPGSGRAGQGSDQEITLSPWQLPELLAVVVVEGDQPPASLRALPNPHASADAVAVPVVPELC